MAIEATNRSLKVKDKIVVGDITINNGGTITGVSTLTGSLIDGYEEHTEDGTATIVSGLITADPTAGAIALAIPAPGAAGKSLIIRDIATGNDVVATATGSTFDGTNNTATFNAAGEQLILYSVSATAWIIILNSGSVTMSDV